MAIKSCKECGKEVSTSARTCPHCGRPSPAHTSTVPALLIIVGVICILGYASYWMGTPASQRQTTTTPRTRAPSTASTSLDRTEGGRGAAYLAVEKIMGVTPVWDTINATYDRKNGIDTWIVTGAADGKRWECQIAKKDDKLFPVYLIYDGKIVYGDSKL